MTKRFVIRSKDDGLFWSNVEGWVSVRDATVFTERDVARAKGNRSPSIPGEEWVEVNLELVETES